jgi:hypothetical protein
MNSSSPLPGMASVSCNSSCLDWFLWTGVHLCLPGLVAMNCSLYLPVLTTVNWSSSWPVLTTNNLMSSPSLTDRCRIYIYTYCTLLYTALYMLKNEVSTVYKSKGQRRPCIHSSAAEVRPTGVVGEWGGGGWSTFTADPILSSDLWKLLGQCLGCGQPDY